LLTHPTCCQATFIGSYETSYTVSTEIVVINYVSSKFYYSIFALKLIVLKKYSMGRSKTPTVVYIPSYAVMHATAVVYRT